MEAKLSGLIKGLSIAIAACLLCLALTALADQTVTVVRGPTEKGAGLYNALELGFGVGYSQPTGDVGTGLASLSDMAGPGAAVEVDAGVANQPQLALWRLWNHRLVLDGQ